MAIARTYKYVLVLLLVWKVIYLGSCSSGWYGTTAHVQESQDFTKKSKSEIIEQFGIPDGFFKNKKNSKIEYWLFRSHHYNYVVFWGKKEEKRLLIKFEDNVVSSVYFVDQGMLDEIATRGWKYLRLVSGKLNNSTKFGGTDTIRVIDKGK
jgi:hypothetical protein